MKKHKLSKTVPLLVSLCLAAQMVLPVMAAENLPADSSAEVQSQVQPEESGMSAEEAGLVGDVLPLQEEAPAGNPEPARASVAPFHLPAAYQEAYDDAFRVDAEHVKKLTNNGGQYGGSALKYLVDGDVKTHWETGKPNTSSFHNSITLTFDSPVELGSLVYYPRVQGAANKGFPTTFSIYASQTEDGEDFTLVCSGNAPVVSGGTQISFSPTTFLRLKFVFEASRQNWASSGELAFYLPDSLVGQVDDLFTDGTMSALKPEYQDLDVLNKMMEQAGSNPDKTLAEKVQAALDIQTGIADYANEVITVEQRGNGVTQARNILQMSSYASNFLPTGYAAKPGDIIKFYVQADENGPMPTVVFTQQIGRFGYWQKRYTLVNGENIITAPRIYSDKWTTKTNPGGAIYLCNPYTLEEQGEAPRVRIAGAIDYPLFRDGDDVDAFIQELTDYKAGYDANPTTTVDIVELYSDLFILNGNLKAASPYLNGTSDPQTAVSLHNDRVSEMLAFAGVDESSPQNSRGSARLNMRLMQPYGAGYAAGDHVGIQQGSANTFFKGQLVGWIYTHEIGHQMDIKGGKVPEVTNNMWANHIAVDIQKEYDRVSYKNIFLQLASDNYAELPNNTNQLGMWWQLHLLNENYWPDYQQAIRAGIAKDMGLTDRERMAVVSSYVLGMDVTEHFERYRFITHNDAIDKALSELGVPTLPENIKPWYLWTKATKDRESSFTETYIPEVLSVETDGSGINVTASISSSADTALLGYEVLQDGKVIGFTSSSSFTTPYVGDDGLEHSYTVRAYDLRMNRTAESEPFVKNLSAPVIKVTGSSLAALKEDFAPQQVVSAYDKDGNDITADIRIAANEVNTGVRGTYSVTYEVTDQAGHTTRLTVPVTVVSAFEYASDVQETSASVGWGSFRKDKSVNGGTITLLKKQEPVTFAKGLGTHASSRVVYDLADSGYTWFEAYVGIDQSMKASKSPSASFQVLVDGVVRYDSGIMKVTDDMRYVQVDVSDAATVELVTDSNGSNASDHTVWGNARFSLNSSAPVIYAQDAVFDDPSQVDINAVAAAVTAEDVEDGDLTGAVTYTTDYVAGKTGSFSITYSVTDSDGNTAREVRSITVVNSYTYVSDQDWKSAKVGWGSIRRDLSLNGSTIKLAGSEGITSYDKGLGVHAYSEVVYDLTGKGFFYFTSDVGADAAAANGNTSIVFQVYVDDELAAETPLMRKGMPAEHISVPLAGASTLKLVVTAGGNGNANDHANWADAKFLIAVQEADKDALSSAVVQAKALDETLYTAGTWEYLAAALRFADDVMQRPDATQAEADTALSGLTGAMDELKLLISTEALEEVLTFAQEMNSLNYVASGLGHADIRLSNLNIMITMSLELLQNPDAVQKDIDDKAYMVQYFIEEMGQTYVPGGHPVLYGQGTVSGN